VLWVGIRDAATEEKATRILREQGAHDVHTHEFPITRRGACRRGRCRSRCPIRAWWRCRHCSR
jgi:hypothetical protein